MDYAYRGGGLLDDDPRGLKCARLGGVHRRWHAKRSVSNRGFEAPTAALQRNAMAASFVPTHANPCQPALLQEAQVAGPPAGATLHEDCGGCCLPLHFAPASASAAAGVPPARAVPVLQPACCVHGLRLCSAAWVPPVLRKLCLCGSLRCLAHRLLGWCPVWDPSARAPLLAPFALTGCCGPGPGCVQVAVLLLVALAGWVHSHKHKKVGWQCVALYPHVLFHPYMPALPLPQALRISLWAACCRCRHLAA